MNMNMNLNADLFRLVFALALDLQRLDRETLRDLPSFALVCRAAASAVRKATVPRPVIAVRARVHRLFDFTDPSKTHARKLLPGFATDKFLQDWPSLVDMDLAKMARRVAQLPQAPTWLAKAERRPERKRKRQSLKQEREQGLAQRQVLLLSQLADLRLPCDHENPSVRAYFAGKHKNTQAAVKAMQTLHVERQAQSYVAKRRRDERETLSSLARLAHFRRLAAKHSLVLPADVDFHAAEALLEAKSVGHAVGHLVLVHSGAPLALLEPRLVVRAGRQLMNRASPPDLDDEVAIWFSTAQAVLIRFNNSLKL
jgi:hypothetical protein